jgi:hypothetical protein
VSSQQPLRLLRVLGRHLEEDRSGAVRCCQRGGAALGDDPSVLEHDDAIAQLLGLGEVVGAQHDGPLPSSGEVGETPTDLTGGHRIERGGRLVEQQHRRVGQQDARQGQPLAHPRGVAGHALVAATAEPDGLQRRGDPLSEPVAGAPNTSAANPRFCAPVRRASTMGEAGRTPSRAAPPVRR